MKMYNLWKHRITYLQGLDDESRASEIKFKFRSQAKKTRMCRVNIFERMLSASIYKLVVRLLSLSATSLWRAVTCGRAVAVVAAACSLHSRLSETSIESGT